MRWLRSACVFLCGKIGIIMTELSTYFTAMFIIIYDFFRWPRSAQGRVTQRLASSVSSNSSSSAAAAADSEQGEAAVAGGGAGREVQSLQGEFSPSSTVVSNSFSLLLS